MGTGGGASSGGIQGPGIGGGGTEVGIPCGYEQLVDFVVAWLQAGDRWGGTRFFALRAQNDMAWAQNDGDRTQFDGSRKIRSCGRHAISDGTSNPRACSASKI